MTTATGEQDLRGFLGGSSVSRFMRWFRTGTGRESDRECLLRELREELVEIGLDDLVPLVDGVEFVFVRDAIEFPVKVANAQYLQMRVFRIYELDTSSRSGAALREKLVQSAENRDRLVLATANQIRSGRAHGRLLGHQAGYLFTNRRLRPNEPEFEG
jgi:hypothetical protein